MAIPLHAQRPVPAPLRTKIRLALLGSALCDALGAPGEFHARFSYTFLSTMQPNGNFGGNPAGTWTDDTSMTLSLARSIGKGEFSEADQLDAYYRWWQHGTLSAVGRCFDIGNTILRAVDMYQSALIEMGKDPKKAAETALPRIKKALDRPASSGNGSLMRVLPVGLAYHHNPAVAAMYGRRSSATTHPNTVCGEACAAWAGCIAWVVGCTTHEGRSMTKLDVLHYFASYPWPAEAEALRTALALQVPLPYGWSIEKEPSGVEAHYTAHHPLLRLLATTVASSSGAGDIESQTLGLLPQARALPSSGYVVHTLVAALYAFLATPSFEAGALLTANMGDDADTVAAVYGGLAGAWYACEEGQGAFWSERVKGWRDALVRRDIIEQVAEELEAFATKP
ncbi:ADP-ribosylation/Crystallin J1 [Roridomyces roridus]|uniref:ADP-ribosylhydrolase ARH3 n=1 Tax=Roridomyces roridus TaxID=1738132 RepID=A0AAD7B9M5_9AGAR|nr:ADP-ribosylation/Crystallin J1 [Roridomyces roridus]